MTPGGGQGKRAMANRKQKAELAFNDLVNDGQDTPEAFVLKVMRNKIKLTKANRQRYDAACVLLPYRLPRLNSIDATNRNVGMTHDEWIRSLEGGDHDDVEG